MKKKHWDWLKIELDKSEHKPNIEYFLTTTYYRPKFSYHTPKTIEYWGDYFKNNTSFEKKIKDKIILKTDRKVEKFVSQLTRDLDRADYIEKIPFWIHRINTIYAFDDITTQKFREYLKYLFISNLLSFSKNINRKAIPKTKISQTKLTFIEEQIEFTNKLKTMFPESTIGKALNQLKQWSIVEKNWDGYEALPPDKDALEFAKIFISNSTHRDFENFECLYGNPQGTVSLEFQRKLNEEKEISLNIDIGLKTISVLQYEYEFEQTRVNLTLSIRRTYENLIFLLRQIITNFNNGK